MFKKYHNSINKIIKVSKAKHYHQCFNIKSTETLEGIKEIIHSKPKAGLAVNSLRINVFLSTKQKQITNSLRAVFCNILKGTERKIIPATGSISCYLADLAKILIPRH